MKRKKSREIIFPLKLCKASWSLLLKNWSDIVSAPDTTIYWSGNKYLFRILIAPLSNENLLPSVEVIAYVFHRKGNQRFSYRHIYEKLNTTNITLVATCACFVTEPQRVCYLSWVTEVVHIHICIYVYIKIKNPPSFFHYVQNGGNQIQMHIFTGTGPFKPMPYFWETAWTITWVAVWSFLCLPWG